MIRALIVDDERHARDIIRLCADRETDLEIVGEAANGADAIRLIRVLAPDLVFLDVRMPGISGLDAIAALDREHVPLIVFVTAYDEYALRAFDLHAAAYLLKPFDDERFTSTMRHVRDLLGRGEARRPDPSDLLQLLGAFDIPPAAGRKLAVRSAGRVLLVDIPEIDWIEAAGNYVRLHVGPAAHLFPRTMAELEATLLPSRFVRIHRSTIVNIDRVTELRTDDNRDFTVMLRDGTALRLSRTYRESFERAIGSSL